MISKRGKLIATRGPPIACNRCGRSPFDAPMLKNEIWDQIALPKECLCLSCVEVLLNRPLTVDDLLDCPSNAATFLLVRRTVQAMCSHDSTFSFGCTPGVTRCDKCGKVYGLERALKGLHK